MDDRKQRYATNKLAKRLRADVGRAITDYGMIEAGDRVMVCLSGGKDSYTLLEMLLSLQRAAPIDFELIAVNLDQKQPGFPVDVLPRYLDALGVRYHILERDTYSIVRRLTPEGATFCPVCSRLRRGTLYGFAAEIGATKVALGHHLDDVVETLFLNMFFGGRLKAMPPKLKSDDGRNILIRPLYLLPRSRHRTLGTGARIPDHPVQPVRIAAKRAAACDQRDARTVGPRRARPRREHRAQRRECQSVTARGSDVVRFCGITPRRSGRCVDSVARGNGLTSKSDGLI